MCFFIIFFDFALRRFLFKAKKAASQITDLQRLIKFLPTYNPDGRGLVLCSNTEICLFIYMRLNLDLLFLDLLYNELNFFIKYFQADFICLFFYLSLFLCGKIISSPTIFFNICLNNRPIGLFVCKASPAT